MLSHADGIVHKIIEKWSTAFGNLDAEALASLYSRGAFFFGSNPRLYRGPQEIVAYFNGLPRWEAPSVRFGDIRIARVGSELINMAGRATFSLDDEASPLSVKITWTIVREDDDWKIASHHVSSYTPLIEQ